MKSTREANHKTREAGRGEAPCRDEGRRTCAGTEVEDPARRALDGVERAFVRREIPLDPHRVPVGRKGVELPPHAGAEQAPEPWVPDRHVRGQSCEPSAQAPDELGSQGVLRWIRTSCPAPTPNISAALPPLIAIATFP